MNVRRKEGLAVGVMRTVEMQSMPGCLLTRQKVREKYHIG